MEPKDLKNSEELKSTKKSTPENSKKNVNSEKENEINKTSPVEKEKKEEVKVVEPLVEKKEEPPKDKVKEVVEVEKTENIEAEEPQKKEKEVAKVDEVEKERAPEIPEEIAETETEKVEEVVAEKKKETKNVESKVVNTEEKPIEKVEPELKKEEATGPEIIAAQKNEESKVDNKEKPPKEKVEPEVKKEEAVEPEIIAAQKNEKNDYLKYTQVELVNAMRDVLDDNGDHNIKDEIETIKAIFYKNLKADLENQKQKFIDDGGNEEEFVVKEDPYEKDIKDLLKRYRHIRIEFNKKQEFEKDENLQLKYQVIEEIKALINNEESINRTFHEFRDLQRRWRDIGLVPQSKMKNLWDTYHFHVENFYDYIKINKELRDLDLKKNMESKINLCESAEELLVEPSIIKAFNTLQKYHEEWREIGPVPIDHKDDIWERFKAATSKINKKHQEFFENRKDEQKKNLEAKTALCEKVEEINEQQIKSHREWDEKSKELIELQKVWRTIGFAPRKDNNSIYERFRTVCDKFFDAKREFYSKNKELQQNNLQMKIDLCNEAEALKDNNDWKKTTQDFINIQKKWKEIGPVPRKHSDVVWKRFRAACDFFFDKKSEHFSSIDTEQVDNLKLKEELIEEVTNFKSAENIDENLRKLKSFQRKWTEIGHVPIKKKDEVQNKFRDAINKIFDELNLDDEKRNLLKFRSKMTSYSESNRGQNKMRMEREKYMNKLKQLENDLILLDNNIGFFAKSKNAESLIADVKKKIENTREKIEFLKEKIRVIDDIDHD